MKVKELFENNEEPREFDGDVNLFLEIKNGQFPLEYKDSIINGDFSCLNNKLTSLVNSPAIVYGYVNLRSSDLKSLSGIGTKYFLEITEILNISLNTESNMLGILKIKSLKRVDSKFKAANIQSDLWEACKIINRHLKSGRRLSKCKEELIEAGLKEFARL